MDKGRENKSGEIKWDGGVERDIGIQGDIKETHKNTPKCAKRSGPARITLPCEFHRLRLPCPQLLPNYSLLLENSSTSGTTDRLIYCPIHGNCLWKPLFLFRKILAPSKFAKFYGLAPVSPILFVKVQSFYRTRGVYPYLFQVLY